MGYWKENTENPKKCGKCIYLPKSSSHKYCEKYLCRLNYDVEEDPWTASTPRGEKTWSGIDYITHYFRCPACIKEEKKILPYIPHAKKIGIRLPVDLNKECLKCKFYYEIEQDDLIAPEIKEMFLKFDARKFCFFDDFTCIWRLYGKERIHWRLDKDCHYFDYRKQTMTSIMYG